MSTEAIFQTDYSGKSPLHLADISNGRSTYDTLTLGVIHRSKSGGSSQDPTGSKGIAMRSGNSVHARSYVPAEDPASDSSCSQTDNLAGPEPKHRLVEDISLQILTLSTFP
jgi:hypothetical protein